MSPHPGWAGHQASDLAPPPPSLPPVPPRRFAGPLFEETTRGAGVKARKDRAVVCELRLDQVVRDIAGDREEHDLLSTLLYQQVHDIGTLCYRHEIRRFRGICKDLQSDEFSVRGYAGRKEASAGLTAPRERLKVRAEVLIDAGAAT